VLEKLDKTQNIFSSELQYLGCWVIYMKLSL